MTDSRSELAPIALPSLAPTPLVSVLISNYNYAHLAPQAIDSVLNQSYSNIEIVICDDGSSDNSVEVLRRYAARDRRVTVLTKDNGGQATGFNLAYRHCHGDILCFLDTDDTYLPNKVERVIEAFRAAPQAGCVLNRVLRSDADGRPRGQLPLFASLPSGWHGPKVVKLGGVLEHIPGTPGQNYRRQIIDRMFPLPVYPPLNMCPDIVMMRLAPLLTAFAAVEEPMASARIHGRNTYQRTRMSAATLRRELTICEAIWHVQRGVLEAIDSRLAGELAPLDTSPAILTAKYMLARLERDAASNGYRTALLSSPACRFRMFWRASAYMPRPVFSFCIDTLTGRGRWKQVAKQISRLFA